MVFFRTTSPTNKMQRNGSEAGAATAVFFSYPSSYHTVYIPFIDSWLVRITQT